MDTLRATINIPLCCVVHMAAPKLRNGCCISVALRSDFHVQHGFVLPLQSMLKSSETRVHFSVKIVSKFLSHVELFLKAVIFVRMSWQFPASIYSVPHRARCSRDCRQKRAKGHLSLPLLKTSTSRCTSRASCMVNSTFKTPK